jgi:hypothetical protein
MLEQDTSLFYTIIPTKPVRFVITEKDTVVDFRIEGP